MQYLVYKKAALRKPKKNSKNVRFLLRTENFNRKGSWKNRRNELKTHIWVQKKKWDKDKKGMSKGKKIFTVENHNATLGHSTQELITAKSAHLLN